MESSLHPLGVRPCANELIDGPSVTRRSGLGSLSSLTDELLLELLSYLPGRTLATLSSVSRALYAFTSHEDLWRTLTLVEYGGSWRFFFDWRSTYAAACGSAFHAAQAGGRAAHARGLYSDVLHHAHRCATVGVDPRWLAYDNLPREAAGSLSPAAFVAAYEAPNTPLVLRGGAEGLWPGLAQGAWGAAALQAAHGATAFHCAGFSMQLSAFLAYAARTQEDAPLYLFDKDFVARAPALGAYTPPALFGPDLLALLGEQARPDWRWLIIGGQKSGSVFHQDPNGTSAFNACLQGRKKWILIPPDMTPPGVWAAQDGSEVCVPLSVMEWLMQFYSWHAKARERRNAACAAGSAAVAPSGKRDRVGGVRSAAGGGGGGQPLQRVYEGVVEAGDIVYVPRGWWHLVLNLDAVNVAVTHNFCSPTGLPHVLRFLKEKPYAVSGVPASEARSLHARFLQALKAHRPELLAGAGGGEGAEAAEEGSKARRWGEVISSGRGAAGQGFSLSAQWSIGAAAQ